MTFAEFQKKYYLSRQDISRKTYLENRKTIHIKKEATAVKNLDNIYGATLKIANKKGFQAMTMRDLSRETGMSMGSLYTYFTSKEELLKTLQEQHRSFFARILEECIAEESDPVAKLRTAILTHLYLSEAMQPWFYFSFMEAKNLSRAEKENLAQLASDAEGHLAYLARSEWSLGYEMEQWPDVVFLKTREHGQ
jgi:AcrR family transcriptional regulator